MICVAYIEVTLLLVSPFEWFTVVVANLLDSSGQGMIAMHNELLEL